MNNQELRQWAVQMVTTVLGGTHRPFEEIVARATVLEQYVREGTIPAVVQPSGDPMKGFKPEFKHAPTYRTY